MRGLIDFTAESLRLALDVAGISSWALTARPNVETLKAAKAEAERRQLPKVARCCALLQEAIEKGDDSLALAAQRELGDADPLFQKK